MYDVLFGKKKGSLKDIESSEMIIISRYDSKEKEKIRCDKDPVPKEFKVGNSKYVLDAAVLRSTNKKHFTSYITLKRNGYAFEGGAYRRIRPMNDWKDILTSHSDQTWKFGTPLRQSRVSQPKEGYKLEEKFNFKKGYQQLFYYKV